jgi:site-specific DNA-cytosine methylase
MLKVLELFAGIGACSKALTNLGIEDFEKAKNAGVSNSQLYKQAGNSIVVNVLMSILNNLLGGKHED